TDDFKLHFYQDDNGFPAASPVASYFPGPTVYRVQTGRMIYYAPVDRSFYEYSYYVTLDPPFQATAGQIYWVQIDNTAVDDPSLCLWNWEVAPPGDASCLWDVGANGWSAADFIDADLAVCLPAAPEFDCNTNGLPDECDIDCGTNGGPCDLPGCGQSADANANGIPDQCESGGPGVPTLSGRSQAALTVLLLGTAGLILRRTNATT
ncbi:MAG: DUF7901 domain-containing protein, partial [Planctomycetota bacterium]